VAAAGLVVKNARTECSKPRPPAALRHSIARAHRPAVIASDEGLQNLGIKPALQGSSKTDIPGEPTRLEKAIDLARFEDLILPHFHAAHNLARWLLRSSADAEDMVQEATLRAWRSFGSFRGSDGRGWLLAIVRNTCFTWLRKNRRQERADEFDENVHSTEPDAPEPERLLVGTLDTRRVRDAVEGLPVEFREAIVLRELEGLSYKEIGDIAGVPIGTVMSRLARARKRLQITLTAPAQKER
jgi:RNA polymerase sigma-70 factor (ECF subfamily)